MIAGKNQFNKGFSLVELMVVIAIIGVITALGMPSFIIYKAKAARAELGVHYRTIESLETTYFGDNNAYLASDIGPWIVNGVVAACERTTTLGHRVGNCDKLRYRYNVSTSFVNRWDLVATMGKFEIGSANVSYGTPLGYNCAVSFSGLPYKYLDLWVASGSHVESVRMPLQVGTGFDATKNCFD